MLGVTGLLHSDFYIILKFNFVCVSASELDQTFVFNSTASSQKMLKNNEIFEFS